MMKPLLLVTLCALSLCLTPTFAQPKALPNFEVATSGNVPIGNVVTDGALTPQGIWDPLPYTVLGTADEPATSFYIWMKGTGAATPFTVSALTAPAQYNNAKCAPSYTLTSSTATQGQKAVLTITANCAHAGQSYIQFTITPQSHAECSPITYVKTFGSPLIIGTTPGGRDVVDLGTTVPKYTPGSPSIHVADAYEKSTSFWVQVGPNQLVGTGAQPYVLWDQKPETHCTATINSTLQTGACGPVLTGTVMTVVHGKIEKNALSLKITYDCKVDGVVFFNMTMRMPPYLPIVLGVEKVCQYTPGFTVSTTAANAGDIVKDGNPILNWQLNQTVDDYSIPSRTFYFLNSNTEPVTFSAPVITTGDKVCSRKACTGAAGCGSVTNGATLAPGEKGTLIVGYDCGSNNLETQYTMKIVIGSFKHIVFGWMKASGNRPGFNIYCAACPNASQVVVRDGLVQFPWNNPYHLGGFTLPAALSRPIFRFTERAGDIATILKTESTVNPASQCSLNNVVLNGQKVTDKGLDFPMDFWCKPITSQQNVAFSMTLQVSPFNPIQIDWLKQVNYLPGVLVTNAGVDVNTEGTFNNGWGPNDPNPHIDNVDTTSITFDVQFAPKVVSMSSIIFGTPMISANTTKFCSTTVSVQGAVANNSNSWVLEVQGTATVTVTYNCSLTEGTTGFVMFMPVTAEGVAYSQPQWSWVKKTYPSVPDGVYPLNANALNQVVRLTWNVPFGHGAPVFAFYVNGTNPNDGSNFGQYVETGSVPEGGPMAVEFKGLINGVKYQFTVTPENSVGLGSSAEIVVAPSAGLASVILLGLFIAILLAVSVCCVLRCHRKCSALDQDENHYSELPQSFQQASNANRARLSTSDEARLRLDRNRSFQEQGPTSSQLPSKKQPSASEILRQSSGVSQQASNSSFTLGSQASESDMQSRLAALRATRS